MSNPAKIREKALLLNPIDDLMFRKMAEDSDFCEEILQVLLEDPNLVVLENTPQWQGTNLKGRSVILDAKCKLGSGTEVNIEVQKPDDDDHQKRVRYNGRMSVCCSSPSRISSSRIIPFIMWTGFSGKRTSECITALRKFM